jgi:hypothetical protein
MYSSMAGIIPSLIVAGLVLILSWIALSHSAHYRSSGRLGSSYAIGAGAASFAVAFSVLNLAVQWHAINANLAAQELAKGVLVLRVISVTAAVTFVRLMLVGMKEEKFVISASSLSGDYREKDHKLFEEERNRQAKWPVERAAGQATALLLVLCLLWALQIIGRNSLSIDFLNWSFAFSSDDFFMAASYRAERGVLPPRFDATLIWIWRITTLTLFCLVAFQQFAWWLASLIIVLTIFFLILPRLNYIGNQILLRISSWATGLEKSLGMEEVFAEESAGRPNQEDPQSANPATASPSHDGRADAIVDNDQPEVEDPHTTRPGEAGSI